MIHLDALEPCSIRTLTCHKRKNRLPSDPNLALNSVARSRTSEVTTPPWQPCLRDDIAQ